MESEPTIQYPWPEWFPESIRQQLTDFWTIFGRTMQDWERYCETYVPGGLTAVGSIRRIRGYGDDPVGRFVPMWNNMARVVTEDGTVQYGSFEQSTPNIPLMTKQEWIEKATALYGSESKHWVFRCPACSSTQSIASVQAADPTLSSNDVASWIYYSCKGRFLQDQGGCDWTLGGLIRIHKLQVLEEDGSVMPVFCFADE